MYGFKKLKQGILKEILYLLKNRYSIINTSESLVKRETEKYG